MYEGTSKKLWTILNRNYRYSLAFAKYNVCMCLEAADIFGMRKTDNQSLNPLRINMWNNNHIVMMRLLV